MFLTIEEMYAFRAKYLEEIAELEAKVAVVSDFIAFAENKTVEEKPEEVVEGEAEVAESCSNATEY